jgi:chaperone required for assembly of F1-ATPase
MFPKNESRMIEVVINGKPLQTPGRQTLAVPSKAMADAIAAEWGAQAGYSAAKMPLTALAFTAADRITGQKEAIVEVLMVYIDTDTLSYRASVRELANRQAARWQPVLDWAGARLDVQWQTTEGVMPIDQPPQVHAAFATYLRSLNDMQLAAAGVLASSLSSLVLMLAVMEGHVSAAQAFELSRLEEDYQAEQWGHDSEAASRANRLKADIAAAARFLDLQHQP